MSVLAHSPGGYLRSMQMSSVSLFIFVEGKRCDAYFYASICRVACPSTVSFSIRMAKELPQQSGGKESLIQFFRFLRDTSSLLADFRGKKTAALFFLDKDVDDILLSRISSIHVAYTEYYDVTNYLFRYSTLQDAFAASISIDPQVVAEDPLFSDNWCQRAANLWKSWIVMCIVAKSLQISSCPNYRIASPINVPLNGPVDASQEQARMEDLRRNFRGSEATFQDTVRKVERLVDRLFADGEYDRVFKGKWYATIAELDLRQGFPGYDINGCADRIPHLLSQKIDYQDQWSRRLRDAIAKVCAQIG